jgi:hypothetical protein
MALHNFRQVFLPYGFRKQAGKQGIEWEAFNREYSPLGCTIPHLTVLFDDVATEKERERVSKSTRLSIARANKRVEKHMLNIALTADREQKTFWLYDDGCYPDRDNESWQLYQLRLEALCLAGNTDRGTKRLRDILKLLPGARIQ